MTTPRAPPPLPELAVIHVLLDSATWLVSSNSMSLSAGPQLPCPAYMYCIALQYLAELDETQKREGPAALPFGKPLQPVSASELGFAGARLDSLVSCLWRLLWI